MGKACGGRPHRVLLSNRSGFSHWEARHVGNLKGVTFLKIDLKKFIGYARWHGES